MVLNGKSPRAPLTYFNDRGVQVIFLGQILAKSDFFWVYERCRDFLGCKKNRGIFLGLQKKD